MPNFQENKNKTPQAGETYNHQGLAQISAAQLRNIAMMVSPSSSPTIKHLLFYLIIVTLLHLKINPLHPPLHTTLQQAFF